MLGAVATLVAGTCATANGEARTPERGDTFCGPRCVCYILRHYGLDADLVDVVREVQGPQRAVQGLRMDAGSDLASLEKALNERGIHTAALEISPAADLKWPSPVIVHLRPLEDMEIGHFVVWLPSAESNSVTAWVGLAGLARTTPRQFARRRSGAVLLTSVVPIIDPESAVRRSITRSCGPACIAVAILVAAFLGVGYRRRLDVPKMARNSSRSNEENGQCSG